MDVAQASPWLTVDEAATYTRCRGPKSIYRAVKRGTLRAARCNERGDLRFRTEWLDAWLEAAAGLPVPPRAQTVVR